METICLTCQILFYAKNKKTVIKLLSSADLAERLVKVNMHFLGKVYLRRLREQANMINYFQEKKDTVTDIVGNKGTVSYFLFKFRDQTYSRFEEQRK